MNHPKVLHVGFQPIGAPTNSGLTLGSMFDGWPDARLMQMCLKPEPLAAPRGTLVVAPLSVAPLDGLVRSALGRHVPSGSVDGLNNSVSRRGRSMSLGARARVAATTINDIGPVHLPKSCARAIAEFRPQVVHSLLGGVRAMRLALAVSRRFDLPIVPHFMDDWPENLFADGRLFGLPRRSVVHDLDDVLVRSPVLLTIGDDMRSEFEQRYAKPTAVVGNSVDIDLFEAAASVSRPEPGLRVMRYVGGLHLGRDILVGRIAEALTLRAHDAPAWSLELFVPPMDASRAERLAQAFPVVHHRGSVAPADVPGVLTSAHAQVFLESSDPDIAAFTRLSVSTKVPQYLAARRPVLVLGNPDQGSVRALLSSGLGVYAGHDADPDALGSALLQVDSMVEQPMPRASNLESFDVRVVRKRMVEWISRAAVDWDAR